MNTSPLVVEGLRVFEWRHLVVQAFACLTRLLATNHASCFGVDQLAARVAENWPLVHSTIKVPDADLLERRVEQFLESDPSSFVGTEYGEGERKRVLWSICRPLAQLPSLHAVQHFGPAAGNCVPAESQAADSLLALAFAEPYHGSSFTSPATSLIVTPNGDAAESGISLSSGATGCPPLGMLLAGCPPGADDEGALAWLATRSPHLALDVVADLHERACPEAVLPNPYGYGKLALLLAHPSHSFEIANALRAVRLRACAEAEVTPKEEVLEQYSWQGCLGSEITVKKIQAADVRSRGTCVLEASGSSSYWTNGTTSNRAGPTYDAILFCLLRVENVLHNAARAYAPIRALTLQDRYFPVTVEGKSAPRKKRASRGWPTSKDSGSGSGNGGNLIKVCTNCGTETTSAWRRCPDDGSLLCNSCGLYYKTYKRHRPNKDSEPVVKVKRTKVVESRHCGRCGATETPVWRRGSQNEMLCNACGLQVKEHDARKPANRTSDIQEARSTAQLKRCKMAKGIKESDSAGDEDGVGADPRAVSEEFHPQLSCREPPSRTGSRDRPLVYISPRPT